MHVARALLLLFLVAPLSAVAAKGAEQGYEEARASYYALKRDAARRKFRHHWLNVAHKFESVATRFPKSERAPDALFTAAELYADLSRLSQQEEDLQSAITNYRRLCEAHSRHRLADDAALALGRIYFERLSQPELARRALTPFRDARGDMVREIRALLASLPAEVKKPAAKVVARRTEVGTEAEAEHSALLEAIARISREAPPKGEREPSRPSEPREPKDSVAALELPTLADVQEKLRQVRIGEEPPRSPPVPADDERTRARVARLARDEAASQLSLAAQLGLKIRRVVIDPGHGGHDTGAIGRGGTREKDVALAIAKRLATHLSEAGLEVVLTRDDDSFVRLEDRAKMANEARGDLFISVHCNSAPSRKLRGVETYTLNTSADRYSIRLAARENATSEKGISDLQFILADLATKANTEESNRLAGRVQRALVAGLRARYPGVKDLGNKEALFYVLLGAKMPAILVETSFLSHPEEEERLASKAYQEDVAKAIAAGVREFLGERERLAKVD